MSESQENSNNERMNQAEEESEEREDLALTAMRTASEEAKLDALVEGIKTLSAQGLADLLKRLGDLPPEQKKAFLGVSSTYSAS
jgi:hypothetical protein